MQVVSDTGPIHYLVLIDAIGILPALFGSVSIPRAVQGEMTHPETPAAVRDWCAPAPPWLSILSDRAPDDPSLGRLHMGERQAILLAKAISADLVLMDDRAGVRAARAAGFAAVGTLGLLSLGLRRGLLDIQSCIGRLRNTGFRCRPELYERVLATADGAGRNPLR